MKDDFRRLSQEEQDNIQVIYPPLDLEITIEKCRIEKNCFNDSVSDPTLIFIGRLDTQKRPDLFIRTAELVQDVKVRIIGDGPLYNQLKSKVYSDLVSLSRRITWKGALPHEAIQLELTRSYASVLLITSSYEGVPIVVLEALGTGTPVITAKCGGVKEVIQDSVWESNPTEFKYKTKNNQYIIINRYKHGSLILIDCDDTHTSAQLIEIFSAESKFWFKKLREDVDQLGNDRSQIQRWQNAQSFRKKFSLDSFTQRWIKVFRDL